MKEKNTSFKVHDTKRGHIFATLAEACEYAAMIARTTGVFVAVTESKAKPTHIFKI